jgi:asparagine synthase (glutamine-hydrolysing)
MTYSLPKFGLAGIVDLSGNRASKSVGALASAFQLTLSTTSISWHGIGIDVVTFQHCEDARLKPGRYELRVPQVGPYQGVVYGQFFGATCSWKGLNQSWPEAVGHRMISNYSKQGASGLTDLNGAWVGVIWDGAQQRVVFARDAVGVETLYVVHYDSSIVFASDLRVLRAIGIADELDEQAIAEFLHFLYVPAPRTIYEDVCAVLPGHVMIVHKDGSGQQRFSPPRFVRGAKMNNQKQIDSALVRYLPRFERLLCTAVHDCLPRRGRVGLLLSWGKDSSTLAIALSQIAPDRVVAITVGGQNTMRVDESKSAARVCKYLGIPHQICSPEPGGLMAAVKTLATCQDQPFGDPASLPLPLAIRRFPDDVSVILDGTGNDYYFGFVKRHAAYRLRAVLQRIIPRTLWPVFVYALRSFGPQALRNATVRWERPLEDTVVHWNGWTQEELSRLWQRNISFVDTLLWRRMREGSSKDIVVLQTEIYGGIWEPHADIRKTLHLGHEAGKAVRFPFIDNRLAQFVNTLPQELQFQGQTNKILLRYYLAKHLPDELIEKRKGYFSVNLNSVLCYRDGIWLSSLQEAGLLRIRSDWTDSVLEELLSCYKEDPDRWAHKLYALCLIATWAGALEGLLPAEIAATAEL